MPSMQCPVCNATQHNAKSRYGPRTYDNALKSTYLNVFNAINAQCSRNGHRTDLMAFHMMQRRILWWCQLVTVWTSALEPQHEYIYCVAFEVPFPVLQPSQWRHGGPPPEDEGGVGEATQEICRGSIGCDKMQCRFDGFSWFPGCLRCEETGQANQTLWQQGGGVSQLVCD